MLATFDDTDIDNACFVVLDFETVTPKGRPPEPIELAAMRITPGLVVDSNFDVNWLIRPPAGAPITTFDTAQTGIRWEDVEDAPSVAFVLTQFQSVLGDCNPVLVAQNAKYEAAIIRRLSEYCSAVARMPFVDTIALAKYLIPRLDNYKLDSLARHLSITIPQHRHRALPDVELTLRIFLRLLHTGKHQGITKIIDLRRVADIDWKAEEDLAQPSLFG